VTGEVLVWVWTVDEGSVVFVEAGRVVVPAEVGRVAVPVEVVLVEVGLVVVRVAVVVGVVVLGVVVVPVGAVVVSVGVVTVVVSTGVVTVVVTSIGVVVVPVVVVVSVGVAPPACAATGTSQAPVATAVRSSSSRRNCRGCRQLDLIGTALPAGPTLRFTVVSSRSRSLTASRWCRSCDVIRVHGGPEQAMTTDASESPGRPHRMPERFRCLRSAAA
jgi:hypothetical protein